MVILYAIIAILTALSNGATAVRPATAEQLDIMAHDMPDIATMWQYEGPACDTFVSGEPCFVIVHGDMTVEVGP